MKKIHLASIRKFKVMLFLSIVLLGISGAELSAKAKSAPTKKKVEAPKTWVTTWSTAPQLVEPNNMPPAPGLTNNTIRQIVRVSIGGEAVRLRFSNVFSNSPVTLKSVSIAVPTEESIVDIATQKLLTFDKKSEVTMAANAETVSDPVAFKLVPGTKLAITISFGETSPTVTGHPGSRTTSFILAGDQMASVDFAGATKTDHWYVINAIDVQTSTKAAAIAIIGNSITDGRGSGTNKQNRWADVFSDRLLKNLQTNQFSVLNLGIGGNCVVRGGLGPTALKRFDRDILAQNGVRWLIVFEGINDIGGIRSKEIAPQMAKDLIDAYTQMIDKAHAKGIKVYGATIMPFAKSFYDADYRQTARDSVNAWIRTSGHFDAVIDFDKTMENPAAPKTILLDMHDNDFLHPNQAGHKRLGESIDLNLFK
jgi:lysophospholipase L1-like esterase